MKPKSRVGLEVLIALAHLGRGGAQFVASCEHGDADRGRAWYGVRVFECALHLSCACKRACTFGTEEIVSFSK